MKKSKRTNLAMDWDEVFPDKTFELHAQELLKKAPAAIELLRRVTGKTKLSVIRPLEEKRWGDKCWEAYELLVDINTRVEHGLTIEEADSEFFKGFKPMDEVFVGKHETALWKL